MDDAQKDKIKKMFSDWNELLDERKGMNQEINKLLKKDEEYLKMMQEKKEFLDRIKERKQVVSGQLIDEKDKVNENMKLIISDVKDALDLNSNVVNSIFKYYKKRFDHGIDELDTIVMAYMSIFDIDDEKGED